MSRVQVSAVGAIRPADMVSALTDFSPNRSKIFSQSSPGLFQVHEQGDTWADVTEGTQSGGIWQRYRYDWSEPDVVRLTVTQSNAFGPGSYWTYRMSPVGEGRTRVDLEINRKPTTVKGKLFDPLLRVIGKVYFGRDLRRTLRRIEALDAER